MYILYSYYSHKDNRGVERVDILGVSESFNRLKNKMLRDINFNLNALNFVLDNKCDTTNILENDVIRIFRGEQDNWGNCIEYQIIEKEVI